MKTARRHFIDSYLNENRNLMRGAVLDVGGKKVNKRGDFVPPIPQVDKWEYLNLDKSTEPDICCDACDVTLPSGSRDVVLLCEVLEHLKRPEQALSEAARVLRPGGILFLTMPFLIPAHSDPDDYQRWTADKIRMSLSSNGFVIIKMKAMGHVFSVISDVLYFKLTSVKVRSSLSWKIKSKLLQLFRKFSVMWDHNHVAFENITTGFFVVAEKRLDTLH